MRLTTVAISTARSNEEVEFALGTRDPRQRYVVRSIVGLDADELVPKFYGFGLVSGRKHYEYTMPKREIVIRVYLNPIFSINEGVDEIRKRIWRLISSSRDANLMLEFRSGSSTLAAINGKITKMEVAYFAQTPELQVTVECPDPMFRSINPVDFPIEELPTATNPVRFSDGASTANHGLSFKVKFTAITATFVVQDHATTPEWKFQVTPSSSFQVNDELWVSSEYGQKQVFWNKASETDIDIVDKVTNDSVWPQVFPGLNELYFPQLASFDWLEFKFYSAFWGL